MRSRYASRAVRSAALGTFLASTIVAQPDPDESPRPAIDFDRDVRPILAQNCFACHGPDAAARRAELRLDVESGVRSVVTPGAPDESELLRRIRHPDPGKRMPPPDSESGLGQTSGGLVASEIELLARWIDEGLAWSEHWAFAAPERPSLPEPIHPGSIDAGSVGDLAIAPIDRFVRARLGALELEPSEQADRATLLRRVSFDLTGLPPTLEELDAFLSDASEDAFETVVDRLLASERYGEHMAVDWLDGARYADTNGYQNDFARGMWPWRDWVVRAFNDNMPYDRFVVEQVAGDLLPAASLDQRVATGFGRNHRSVTEAGAIDEEWRVENVVDRVETTATVFLGLTLGCARCHDHKFDPVSQEEFYAFYAFFNNVDEQGVHTEVRGNVPPLVEVPTPADLERLQGFERELAAARAEYTRLESEYSPAQSAWEAELLSQPAPEVSDGLALRYGGLGASAEGAEHGTLRFCGPPAATDDERSGVDLGQAVQLDRGDSFSFAFWARPEAQDSQGAFLSKMDDRAAYRGFDTILFPDRTVAVHLIHEWPTRAVKVVTRQTLPTDRWSHVVVTYDGSSTAAGVSVWLNGRRASLRVESDTLDGTIETSEPLRLGRRSTAEFYRGSLSDVRIYGRRLSAEGGDQSEIYALLRERARSLAARAAESDERADSRASRELLELYRAAFVPALAEAAFVVERLERERREHEEQFPTCMVLAERSEVRPTYVLRRGRYDAPDESRRVQPDVPAFLPPLAPGQDRNRLGLARWLVDPRNPLVARVAVNRLWQRFFGVGLVETAENFGIQGARPSHPELLDWLATELVDQGWDLKAMQRQIVLSATYRQSSRVDQDSLARDARNRWLARGPRHRLSAEVLRDNALAVSGLLVERLGGAPVRPYQPEGLWTELAGGAGQGPYVVAEDDGLYRRSLYIHRKRTVPHPTLSTFDAPSFELCQVRRSRTNTPLQSFALLNDVTYVEAARAFAERMLREAGPSAVERIARGFRLAVARLPTPQEERILLDGLKRYSETYAADPEAARAFVTHGRSAKAWASADVARERLSELAAYTAIASVILNLDETISKP